MREFFCIRNNFIELGSFQNITSSNQHLTEEGMPLLLELTSDLQIYSDLFNLNKLEKNRPNLSFYFNFIKS